LADVLRAVAHDDDYLFDATRAQVIDATLDDGFVSERQ
jgi:hypothetical protein